MTTEAQTIQEKDDYNVRLVGPQIIKKALKAEQNRRYQETDQEVNLMDIAKEWLAEKAAEVLRKTAA